LFARKGLIALTMLVLLALPPGRLLGQVPEWAPRDQYGQPYAVDQQSGSGDEQPYTGEAYPEQSYAPQPASVQPLTAVQLEQLVAPIALYPDALVAQVLAASTYPRQVEEADRWRQAQGYASPEQIADGADVQPWDPSVKALTAFPQVLAQMDRNLRWTTAVGNAYYNQPQDVLEAVQIMRRRAQAAGSLQSTPQEVVREDQGYIELEPANPQVAYVPAYNPWTVYGEPVAPYPGFSLLGVLGDIFGGSPVRYGLGIALSAFTHTPWGWLAWGLNWLTHALLFDHSDYFSNSNTVSDWGFPHRGFYAYAGHRGFDRRNDFARGHGGDGWRRAGGDGSWHTFARAPGMHAQGWGERSRGEHSGNERWAGGRFSSGFESFRGERRASVASNPRFAGREPAGRTLADARNSFDRREPYRSEFNRGRSEAFNRPTQSARGPISGFQRGRFGGRSPSVFARPSTRPPRSGGLHLFGGGHSQKSFGGGRAPKNFGGGHMPKSFHAGGKSFGGGHSHGGGHSGGHGGGRHHG